MILEIIEFSKNKEQIYLYNSSKSISIKSLIVCLLQERSETIGMF